MNSSMPSSILYCIVCNKSQHEVRYLVAGDRINICSECVAKLNQKIQESRLVRIRRKLMEDLQKPTSGDNIH